MVHENTIKEVVYDVCEHLKELLNLLKSSLKSSLKVAQLVQTIKIIVNGTKRIFESFLNPSS